MLFKNAELEKHKETEKMYLIEKVVENFFEYSEFVNEKQKYLANLSHHVVRNSMNYNPTYPLTDIDKVFEKEEDRNNRLATNLEFYSKESHYLQRMKEIIKTYSDLQIQLKNSIDDLKHFYKVTKYSRSKAKKISLIDNVLKPIGDLSPLNDIEDAYRNIDEFKNTHSFRFIGRYLEKNRKGHFVLDKHNVYVVNPYYFSDRVVKLKGNIKNSLESTQKQIFKITKNHKNEEQLKRYLQY